MRKLFFCGLMLACASASAAAPEQGIIAQLKGKFDQQFEGQKVCPSRGPTGPCGPHGSRGPHGQKGCKGPKGCRGERGDQGPKGATGVRGPTGSVGGIGATGPGGSGQEINDVIEVSTRFNGLLTTPAVGFISPIDDTNGIDFPSDGGMTLVQSIPLGDFDTITLPIEPAETFYLVTYGASLAASDEDSTTNFILELNGSLLPYTALGMAIVLDPVRANHLYSTTSVIVNPANTAGTLRLITSSDDTSLQQTTPLSPSAYMTVVKLNGNALP